MERRWRLPPFLASLFFSCNTLAGLSLKYYVPAKSGRGPDTTVADGGLKGWIPLADVRGARRRSTHRTHARTHATHATSLLREILRFQHAKLD